MMNHLHERATHITPSPQIMLLPQERAHLITFFRLSRLHFQFSENHRSGLLPEPLLIVATFGFFCSSHHDAIVAIRFV